MQSNPVVTWEARIQEDLRTFADPGEPIATEISGTRITALWSMRGVDMEREFLVGASGAVRVQANGGEATYPAFLAGRRLADLEQVAKAQARARPMVPFVDAEAQRDDDSGREPETRKALNLLDRMLRQQPDSTRVIMLTGAAGTGKTHVLRELVRRKAVEYTRGQTSKLLLYVNAQGRALSRLNEALAAELQDLRVSLTYHSVPCLTRVGQLVPVIDGFDELLGVSDYDDAFGSLTGFLRDLDGAGQVLAAARSEYYEDEFARKMARQDAAWRLDPIRLKDWSEANRCDYLRQYIQREGLTAGEKEALRGGVRRVFTGSDDVLARKPFFFATTVELLRKDPEFDPGDDLAAALIQEYLRREREEKLLDKQGRPLLTEEELFALMREVAQEMWNLETRKLTAHSANELADYFSEAEELSADSRRVLKDRIHALALFGGRSGSYQGTSQGLEFEHESYFSYFLADGLLHALQEAGPDVRSILSRSPLPPDAVDRVAKRFAHLLGEDQGTLQKILDDLAEAGNFGWRRSAQVQENAGRLAMALLRETALVSRGRLVAMRIRSLVFPGDGLENVTLENGVLQDIEFRRTDLRRTRFVNCTGSGLLFSEPLLQPDYTRLEIDGLTLGDVAGLRYGAEDLTYRPHVIAETLRKCGTTLNDARLLGPLKQDEPLPAGTGAGPVSPEVVNLVERMVRLYRRTNRISVSDDSNDPRVRKLVKHARWQAVQRALERRNLVKVEQGPGDRTLMRSAFLPDQLMRGLYEPSNLQSHDIRRFWNDLRLVEGAAG